MFNSGVVNDSERTFNYPIVFDLQTYEYILYDTLMLCAVKSNTIMCIKIICHNKA